MVTPHALSLELVEQAGDLLGLAALLGAGELPGAGVGVDQTQLPHGVAGLAVLHDAGDAALELLAAAVPDQHDRRPAPVAGDDGVALPVGADADRIQQAHELDVPGQLVQTLQRVKVVRVRINQIQRKPHDLFGVQIGHAAQHAGQVKALLIRHCAAPPLCPGPGPANWPAPGSPCRGLTWGSS